MLRVTLKPIIPRPRIRIRQTKIMDALRQALDRFSTEAMTDLTYYPPQLAGTHYVRTFRLRSSWVRRRARRAGNTLKTSVYSEGRIAPYNDDVQGPGQTADMKRRDWRQVDYPINARWPAIQAGIRAIFHDPTMWT